MQARLLMAESRQKSDKVQLSKTYNYEYVNSLVIIPCSHGSVQPQTFLGQPWVFPLCIRGVSLYRVDK